MANYPYPASILYTPPPPPDFVCGGYTVFMLSVRASVRNVLFF